MPRRRRVSVSVNHERWLISYSDFITLLFAFFVVMYSISQVNEGKYRVLSDTLQDAFHVTQQSISPIQVGDPSLSRDPSVIENTEPSRGETLGQGAFDKMADLPQLSQQVSESLADLVNEELVQINSNEFWLQIELKSSILFETAKTDPSPQARAIFSELAQIFKGFENPIQVEGFTDDVPIRTDRFASNWELSSSRAAATVQLLVDGGVKPRQLAAVGYGEHQPIARNDSPEGRAQNRRVVLMIAREKIERPGVKSGEDILQATREGEFLQSTPFPEEGLTNKDVEQEQVVTPLSADEPLSGLDLLLDGGESSAVSEPAEQETISQEPATESAADGVRPVELEGGGLLFSSDPDLPRN